MGRSHLPALFAGCLLRILEDHQNLNLRVCNGVLMILLYRRQDRYISSESHLLWNYRSCQMSHNKYEFMKERPFVENIVEKIIAATAPWCLSVVTVIFQLLQALIHGIKVFL